MTLTIYFEGAKYFSMTFVVDSVKQKKIGNSMVTVCLKLHLITLLSWGN